MSEMVKCVVAKVVIVVATAVIVVCSKSRTSCFQWMCGHPLAGERPHSCRNNRGASFNIDHRSGLKDVPLLCLQSGGLSPLEIEHTPIRNRGNHSCYTTQCPVTVW